MKQLIVLIGPNGVGKSTTAEALLKQKEKTAYVDSDWCRVMNPFSLTEKTKQTVINNIYCLLRNYLICNDIETVVFPYSWHGDRKEIYDTVINRLKQDKVQFEEKIYILKCSREENERRARKDGRDEARIKRGMEMTFSFYDELKYPCIDTTEMTPEQVAAKIVREIVGFSE